MLGQFGLKGGIHPAGHKIADVSMVNDFQILKGDEFFIPFIQHIGSPAVSVVQIGDYVEKGSLIAECGKGLSSNIHSPVSGKVKDISSVFHPAIGQIQGCIITADGINSDYKKIDGGSNLAEVALKAGIVGLGGAGFPTHVKLKPNKPVETC